MTLVSRVARLNRVPRIKYTVTIVTRNAYQKKLVNRSASKSRGYVKSLDKTLSNLSDDNLYYR